MGFDVSKHSAPSRKRNLFAKRIRRLKAAVQTGESAHHVSKAAEKVRRAAWVLIKAKRVLLAEYPQNDADGRRLRNLQKDEQWWSSLEIDSIIKQCIKGNADPGAAEEPRQR